MKTFEHYLSESHNNGRIDHRIRTVKGPNGELDFYIHPDGVDGETLDFTVDGNSLERIPGNHGAGSRPPVGES